MDKKHQQIASFAFGMVFLGALLALAVILPNPTIFQYTVFRVVLALAAAGVTAMIPGFLEVTIPYWLRAGGSLAIFVLIYFYNPASLVTPSAREISSKSKPSDSANKYSEKTGETPKTLSMPSPKNQVATRSGQEKTVPILQDQKSDIAELLLPKGDLVWEKNIESHVLTWPKAQEYCKSLELGGFSDWRLPTIGELASMADKRFSPAINPQFGAVPAGYPPYFWSSTIDPNDNNEAQFLNFKNGLPSHINKEKGHGFVRCVRQL